RRGRPGGVRRGPCPGGRRRGSSRTRAYGSRQEVGVLRVLVDVALDEGAVGAHLLPAFADLVEGPADQCGTDAAALEAVLDHGVREDQHVGVGGVGLVFGVARDDAGVVDRLVARLLGVVLDGDVGAFTHGPTVPVPG